MLTGRNIVWCIKLTLREPSKFIIVGQCNFIDVLQILLIH